MIAIIESTFRTVSDDKTAYSYRNKAEMNLESFEILQFLPWFKTCDEYRSIIFSTFVDESQGQNVIVHGRDEEIEDLMEKVQEQL